MTVPVLVLVGGPVGKSGPGVERSARLELPVVSGDLLKAGTHPRDGDGEPLALGIPTLTVPTTGERPGFDDVERFVWSA